MNTLTYRLPVFEGPLDLLLHLIAKNQLSITEIRISSLLEQYMEQITSMQEADLDVASEFLEMASRLVHIKTVFLLPKHEEADELEKELVGQLLEYQACKEMAARFAEMYSADQMVREQEPLPKDLIYRRRHDPQELRTAYQRAVGNGKRFQPPPIDRVSALVTRRQVSVTSQIIYVIRTLRKKGATKYLQLFSGKQDKSEMVATFLAVLELVKAGRIAVRDTDDGSSYVELRRGGMTA